MQGKQLSFDLLNGIIYSTDFYTHLDQVFKRLVKHVLILQPTKCQLWQREVVYLGHVVSQAVPQFWHMPTSVNHSSPTLTLD